MNKLRTILTWGLLLAATHVMGYTITVNPIEIEAGQSTDLIINLSNTETNLTAYQMSLYLPEGVTVQKKANGKYAYTANPDRHDGEFTFSVKDAVDGSILIAVFSADKDVLIGTDGELIRLPINVASTVTTSLQGSIKNIEFADVNSQAHNHADVTFGISVSTPSPAITFADPAVKALCVANWDTDGDGELSEAEAAAVTDLGEVFRGDTTITYFNELQYFTGLTSIHDNAFEGCTNLTSIILPNGLITIGGCAFRSTAITSLTIPASVTYIAVSADGGGLTEDCTSLMNIYVEEDNSHYYSENGVLFSEDEDIIGANGKAILLFPQGRSGSYIIPSGVTVIAQRAFVSCKGLNSIVIPEGVTTIAGEYAFHGCSNLSRITIPSSMTNIGDGSFYNCSSISDVWCRAEAVPSTSSWAFYGSPIAYATLHVLAVSLQDYQNTAPWSGFGTIIAIEEELNTENVDIASAEDLANFAARVNAGEIALSATLKTDIDFTAYPNVMIGNNSYYRGEFNGAGHSIKLALNRTSNNAALFYRLSGHVHDLTITGTITTSAKYAGGIAGETSNATIERCQSRVNIISTVNGDGTHGGIVGAAGIGSIIRDCLFSGSITGSQTKCCGGVSGWSGGSVSITNCLITSTFSVSTEDSDILSRNSSNVTSSNNYFQGTWDAANNCTDVTLLTENQVESGEACYLLNNGRTDDEMVWYQTLGVDDCPVPDKRRLAVLFDNGAYVNEQVVNITFADPAVKAICVGATTNWDTNHDGELSEAEAAAVTDLGEVFKRNTEITSFDELQYFTGLTTIGNNAFSGCTALTSVTIPDGVTTIGHSAFRDSGLETIVFPNSVTNIGARAFDGCSNLTSVTMPASVITFDENEGYAFGDTNNIEAVYVSDLTAWLGTSFPNANNPLRSGAKLYLNNVEVTDLVIPDGTTAILTAAFEGCESLTSVTIPSSVTSISGWAFAGNINLATVTIAESVTSIGGSAFKNCSSLTSINIPNGITSIEYETFSDCQALPSINIPNSVTSIGQNAFRGCQSLESVFIPESVTSIGTSAFQNCYELTSANLPNGITTINPYLFCGCKLNSITIPDGVTSIGDYAFHCCDFSTVVIPESVTEIGANAFRDCYELTSANLPNGITTINPYLFCGSPLTSIRIPNGVTSIGEWAFFSCNLSTIVIPENVESIGDNAFANCTLLTSVKVDIESPLSINSGTFYNSQANATLYVPYGSKAAYQAASYWQEFKNIVEFIYGDVNSDEEVDVLDVVDIVRYTVGSPAETFVPILADINYNGEVNVGDAVALVNEIAGEQNFVKPWRAPQQNSVADDVLTLTSTDNGMSLCMENERNYTAFQFDLFLPAGTDATDMLLNAQRKQGHQLIYNKVEEGHYRVAAISTSNRTFSGYKGELLAVGLEGIASEDICLRNIRFFTTDGEEHRFDDIVMQSSTATDIASPRQPSNEEAQDIYDLQGRKMVNGKWLNGKSSKGIYIVNGKKIAF